MLPTLHVRVDDTVYLHGSTGGRPLLAARGPDGLPVCLSVTLLDGLVYGRSQFHHSANYRSVVAHGTAHLVTDEAEKQAAMTALVEKVGRGRAADSRPPTRKELAETAVLALPLREVSVRARVGPVIDEPEDYALPHWAGVLPLRLVPGPPEPDAGVTAPVPDYLRPPRSPWLTPAPMAGAHVRLEPLDLAHIDELYAATDDAEVWRHLGHPRPRPPRRAGRDRRRGAPRPPRAAQRVPWVQRDARTGEVIGSTSYYEIDDRPGGRSRSGTPSWAGRGGVPGSTPRPSCCCSTRAFDELGAERVVWHTDIRNERSQRAIERLGAQREGVLRRHRQRPDGSWRDTVLYAMTVDEWPKAQLALRESLRPAPPVER